MLATTREAVEVIAAQSLSVTETTKTVKGQKVTTRTAEASTEAMVLVNRWTTLEKRAKAIKAEQDQIKATLRGVMEDDDVQSIVHEGSTHVTRSVSVPHSVNLTRLRDEYPQVAEMLTEAGDPKTTVRIR